jgi:hypothetical protein
LALENLAGMLFPLEFLLEGRMVSLTVLSFLIPLPLNRSRLSYNYSFDFPEPSRTSVRVMQKRWVMIQLVHSENDWTGSWSCLTFYLYTREKDTFKLPQPWWGIICSLRRDECSVAASVM